MRKSRSVIFIVVALIVSAFLGSRSAWAEPDISVSSTNIIFENVTTGCTEWQAVTITSTGTDTLDITAIELTINDFGAYSFLPFPFVQTSLALNESIELVIQFTPNFDTFMLARLVVTSNAADVYIEIRGDGYGTEACDCNPGYVACGSICV